MSDDTIYRQAAIDAIRHSPIIEVQPAYMLIDKADVLKNLVMLPPAQPNPQECKNCIFKPFKQFQPEQKKGKWIFVNKFRGQHKCSVCGVVAVQTRNGFHLESSPTDNTGEHAIVIDHYKEFLSDYCPNCGAKMEGEEE